MQEEDLDGPEVAPEDNWFLADEEDETDDSDEAKLKRGVNEVLRSEDAEKRRLALKPDVSHLTDAVSMVDGKLQFSLVQGDRLVIERVSVFLSGSPWLDTRSFIIAGVDRGNGDLHLIDEEIQHQAMSNYVTGSHAGFKFKVPPQKGAWFTKYVCGAS